jgi:cytochrome c oxidase assembly protein subunit 15
MLFALLIVAVIIYTIKLTTQRTRFRIKSIGLVISILIILSLVQVYFGTQVRQEIDVISKASVTRSTWISQLSAIFEIHRSFAIVIILIHAWIVYKLKSIDHWNTFAFVLFCIIVAEAVSGIVMAYLSVPKAAQPIHLFLATTAFGMQCWLFLHVGRNNSLSTN